MKPKEITELMNLSQSLLELWLGYRRYFTKAQSDEVITQEEEAEFREITTHLTRNARLLGQRIDDKKSPFGKDKINALIRTTVSIQALRELADSDRNGLIKDWHEARIFLSRTVGEFKFRQEGYVPIPKGAASKKKAKGNPLGNPLVIVGILAALGVVGFLIFRFMNA